MTDPKSLYIVIGVKQAQVFASNSYMWRQCIHITTTGVLHYTYMHVKIPFVNACDSHMTIPSLLQKKKKWRDSGLKAKIQTVEAEWAFLKVIH